MDRWQGIPRPASVVHLTNDNHITSTSYVFVIYIILTNTPWYTYHTHNNGVFHFHDFFGGDPMSLKGARDTRAPLKMRLLLSIAFWKLQNLQHPSGLNLSSACDFKYFCSFKMLPCIVVATELRTQMFQFGRTLNLTCSFGSMRL